ncbi:hypothetical protein Cgig2_033084 [Carnegiea gigantea]|uniref:Uncharacterized protein n=1 Tax=Carnegiea gigantea TaxID=171969 RepID=A0A9Q1GXR7_9CARY|nr:hypothetical protein Cgig2_033084 [Carnegiea gigantea]
MRNVKGFAVGGSIYWSTEKIVQACNLGNCGRRHYCFSGEESEIEGERVKEKRAEFEEEKVGCERRRGPSLKRQKGRPKRGQEAEGKTELLAATTEDTGAPSSTYFGDGGGWKLVMGRKGNWFLALTNIGSGSTEGKAFEVNLRCGVGAVVDNGDLCGWERVLLSSKEGNNVKTQTDRGGSVGIPGVLLSSKEDNNVKTQTDRGRGVGIPGPAEDEHHRHSATVVVVVTYSRNGWRWYCCERLWWREGEAAGIEEVRRMVTEISGNELSEQKVWFSLKYDQGLVMALEGDADVRMFF